MSPDFFARPAAEVARDLLGCVLRSECEGERTAGRIVETEAYTGPEDEACHAAERIGRTKRNAPLFGPPGTAYVHRNYGIHWLLNVVTGPEGFPAGVLLRAAEPLEGTDVMRLRRGREELTNGPARLAQALAVGPRLQGHRLDRHPLSLHRGEPVPDEETEVTTRIGISRAADRPLRFYDRRSRWISRR
ncbi:DNA-3-methyladenine glycosylase [Candidatus Palauibacter sp.]|uniref:DNA-3-methyladenine glycosylase n=1 Tax=Candidatus Palauibacter sp. TaxID=3101350 RepID=UPI003C6F7F7E